LNVTLRSKVKKSELKAGRRDGVVPAVLYGSGGDAEMLNIESETLLPVMKMGHGTTLLIDLNIKGRKGIVKSVIREVQRHPTSREILHCDLLKVDMSRKYQVSVPIVLEGESIGVKTFGGLIAVHQRDIEILCLPGEIPESYVVDITEIGLGDTVKVEALSKHGEEEFLTRGDTTIISCNLPRIEEEVVDEEAVAEGAEGEGEGEGEEGAEGESEEKKAEGGEEEKPRK